ncbi:hypothetical protein RND81_05G033100 [Saponaria officinalis]|uniref:S-protein homolog n=1 Tax=Saponaria officinalis TaxID=3572 RepID=A0AAW1KQH6_SAPOF
MRLEKNIFPFITFMIVITSCIHSTITLNIPFITDKTYTIHLGSRIRSLSAPLIVQCTPPNSTKLGQNELSFGKEVSYKLPIIGNTTKFTCEFNWGNGIETNDRSVDVFEYGVEDKVCNVTENVYWKALPDGLYFTCEDDFVGFKRCEWNPQVPCKSPKES